MRRRAFLPPYTLSGLVYFTLSTVGTGSSRYPNGCGGIFNDTLQQLTNLGIVKSRFDTPRKGKKWLAEEAILKMSWDSCSKRCFNFVTLRCKRQTSVTLINRLGIYNDALDDQRNHISIIYQGMEIMNTCLIYHQKE